MMTILAILLFGLAFTASAYATFATIAPNLDRIADALTGQTRHFTPLDVVPVRRRLVRHWQVAPVRMAASERAAA